MSSSISNAMQGPALREDCNPRPEMKGPMLGESGSCDAGKQKTEMVGNPFCARPALGSRFQFSMGWDIYVIGVRDATQGPLPASWWLLLAKKLATLIGLPLDESRGRKRARSRKSPNTVDRRNLPLRRAIGWNRWALTSSVLVLCQTVDERKV